MAKSKALFNVVRLVSESGNDTSPEVSFLSDFDYTSRQLNKNEPHYYFKKITHERNPEYFDTDNGVNIITLDKLPENCNESNDYVKNKIIYHTNDQNYYIGYYSDGKPSRRYKPSSMKCLRNMYYQAVGADMDKQQQKTSDFYGICESGSDRHERIQYVVSRMKDFGIDCEYVDVEEYINEKGIKNLVVEKKTSFETKLYDKEKNLVFLCDGIIRYKGKYYILEIKTETSFKWMNRNSVDESHRYQAYAYSTELGINEIIFIYENRDLCTKKPYLLSVSNDNRKFLIDRINSCDNYVSQRVVPPVESPIDKRICQYCEYKTQCKLDGR